MKAIIRQAKIIDSTSSYNGKKMDILVNKGVIEAISKKIDQTTKTEIKGQELIVGPGFCDLRAFSREPGFEAMETLESLSATAAAGGFTSLAIMPNTTPVVNHKGDLNYFKRFSLSNLTQFLPVAAVTKNAEGTDFNEMWDLHTHGAIAFSDGNNSLWNADILLKSLQYLAPKNALLIQKAEEVTLAMHGQMHEGVTSTQLGLKGIPSAAEEILIQRDLTLLEYAEIKSDHPVLHFSCISTAVGVALIKKAKKAGLPVSCDVSINNLIFIDEQLASYDTNLKVSPPIRSAKDQKALIKGLKDGTIDAIVTDHQPWDEEHKKCEFDQASNGNIGLQTAVASLLTYTNLSSDLLFEKLSQSPRGLLKLEKPSITENAKADMVVLDLKAETALNSKTNHSLSHNSALWQKPLQGKVLATFGNSLFEIYN